MSNLLNIQGNFTAPVSIGDNLINGLSCSVSANTYSHAEGFATSANAFYSHAEGRETLTEGNQSHATGQSTKAIGDNSTTLGLETIAYGQQSIAGGHNTFAKGNNSLALGVSVSANENNTFAWSGNSSDTDTGYQSKGVGTFNINPVNGVSGFYLGNKNLGTILNENFDTKIKEHIAYKKGITESRASIINQSGKIDRSNITEAELNTLDGMTTNIKSTIENTKNTLRLEIDKTKNQLINSVYADTTINNIVHKDGREHINGIKKFLSGSISIYNENITGKGTSQPIPNEYKSGLYFKGVSASTINDQIGVSSDIGGIQSSIKGTTTSTDIYATKYSSTLSSDVAKISVKYFADPSKNKEDVFYTYTPTPVEADKISYAVGNDVASEYQFQIANVVWTENKLKDLRNDIDRDFVSKSKNETITGTKTFTKSPLITTITNNNNAAVTVGYVSDKISENNQNYYTKNEINNSNAQFVTLTSVQNISGEKTFSKPVRVSNVNIEKDNGYFVTNISSVKSFVNNKIDNVINGYSLEDIVHKTNTNSFSIKAGNSELVGTKDSYIKWRGNALVDTPTMDSKVNTAINSFNTRFNTLSSYVEDKIKYTWYREPAKIVDLTNHVYGSSDKFTTWWNWNHGSGNDSMKKPLTLKEDIKFAHKFYAQGLDLSKTSLNITSGFYLNVGSILKKGTKIYIAKNNHIWWAVGWIKNKTTGVLNTKKIYFYNDGLNKGVEETSNAIIYHNKTYASFNYDVEVTGGRWDLRYGCHIEKESTIEGNTVLPALTVIPAGTTLKTDFIVPNYEIILSDSLKNYDEFMIMWSTDSAGSGVDFKTYPTWLWKRFVETRDSNTIKSLHCGYCSSHCYINPDTIGYQNFTIVDENNLCACMLGIKYAPV